MKKNFTMRTAAIVLALILATACLVSGTFAKYVTVVSGTDTARVAFFKFGADQLDEGTTKSFNLWDTVNDADVHGETGNIGTDDTKIIAPGTSGYLDLGLWGMAEVDTWVDYEIALTNTNNVPLVFEWDGKYYSDVLTGNAWIVKGESAVDNDTLTANDPAATTSITIDGTLADIAELMDRELISGTALETSEAALDTITWFWAYENWGDAQPADEGDVATGDAVDTALGNAAVSVGAPAVGETANTYTVNALEVTLDVTVTFTQID